MTSRKKQVTQTKVHQNKQYQDILNKYKKMAGEYKNSQLYAINKSDLINHINSEMSPLPITTIKKNIVKKSVEKSINNISPVKISQNKTGSSRSPKILLERESISKDNEDQPLLERNKEKPLLTQVSQKMSQTNNFNGNKQRKSMPKDKNKTQIKFLVEKQHQVVNDQKYNLKLMEVQSIKPDLYLNSTKRSSSLPLIAKNSIMVSPSKTQQQKNDRHKSAKGKQQQGQISNSNSRVKRPISIENKVQKQRQLNSVAFSLLNLKQRISDIKGVSMATSRMKNNTSMDKKPQQSRQIDHKQYQSEYWINKSRVLNSTKPNNPEKHIPKQEQAIKYKEIGNNDSKDKDTTRQENIEKDEAREVSEMQENGDKKIKIIKLKQKKEQLQQIKQDIQNQNLQKEELLKSHRNINRNLQMDVKNKSQRISQLQNELTKMQSQNVGNKQIDSVDDGQILKQRKTQTELQELQREKRQKEKKYNKQKQLVKQEIKKIEHRILEQELKYKTLKSKQLQIKNEQLIKKQEQLIEKNKQLGQDLQKKTRELEEKIKSEQQKLYVYKLQLQEQNKKNENIWRELKKQQQLQDLLMQKIQKIMKEKDHEAKAKQQRKQKQKIKIMQEIKALQETESKLLTEYKRDSEAVNSIFEAMRLKNIELQNNIKQKLKKKEKEKQVKQKNQLQQNI